MPTQRRTSSSQPGNRKWLIWLLSILGALVFLVALGVGGTVWYARRLARNLTEAQPASLPVVELTRDEQRRVERNLNEFLAACKNRQARRIEFSAQDLNGIIGALDEFREARGKAAVEIVDGVPWIQASIPLRDSGVSWLRDRYLNARFRMDVRLEADGLRISVADVEVPGGQLPDWAMRRIQAEELARHAYRSRDWGPRLRQLESLSFKGDKLVVQTRTGG